MRLDSIVRDLQSRFPTLLPLKASIQRGALQFLRRPFEPEFRILGQLSVPAHSVLLDVGGNRGQSIDAIRLYQPNARIISFEPNLDLAAALSRRYASDPAIEIRPYGLSDRASETELFVPYYRGFMYDGLASFDRDEAHNWLSPATVAGFDPSALVVKSMPCRAETLDSLNLEPFFMKVDVQGFERHVLIGGETTLKTHESITLLATDGAADELLIKWGWTRASYHNRRLRLGEFGHDNTVYVPPSKRALLEGIIN